jgi:hypothetical protein
VGSCPAAEAKAVLSQGYSFYKAETLEAAVPIEVICHNQSSDEQALKHVRTHDLKSYR